jgi:hypothetical protein
LASSISSFTELAGSFGAAVTSSGDCATKATAEKSFSVS